MKKVAIVAHGNGGDVGNFYPFQLGLQQLGYTTYGFDYRGMGYSSGHPSEAGLYLDIEAVWKKIQEIEKIEPAELTVVGISIGSGPAAYLANRIGAGTLLLLAPYTSIPDVINERPGLRYLRSFSKYYLPTAAYVASSSTPCIVLAYGDNDRIILPKNSLEIEARWRAAQSDDSRATLSVIEHPTADHNSIFFDAFPQISKKLAECGHPAGNLFAGTLPAI